MNEKLDVSPKISDAPMLSPAIELRDILCAELDAERRFVCGKEARARVARRYGISTRRLLAILHREVGRVWADEMDHARALYRAFLAAEERRASARASQLAAERARLDMQDRADGFC